MNAVEVFIVGITIVFLTLSILAVVTFIIGKILSFRQKKDDGGIAAIAAKLHTEGKL
ncbi:MAG: OadG family transporter subunit [Candidatus Thermoplasmatota archaeon]|nr:OadG family transporter subunit [Candidatus Thermoplasmatota archaeon]